MNLKLHTGLLGCLEAGAIALLAGVLVYAAWSWVGRRAGLQVGQVVGGAALTAAVIGAGIDAWNLFYLGMVKLESPVYARLALAGIHDADHLGTRVLMEVTGAAGGTVLGWWLFSHRKAAADASQAH